MKDGKILAKGSGVILPDLEPITKLRFNDADTLARIANPDVAPQYVSVTQTPKTIWIITDMYCIRIKGHFRVGEVDIIGHVQPPNIATLEIVEAKIKELGYDTKKWE